MARGAGDYRYFRILTPGRGAGRYMLAGGTASLVELIDLMQPVHRPAPRQGHGTRTARAGHDGGGRRCSAGAPVPAALQLWRRVGRHARGPIDASATERDLGVRFQPLEDSIADMLRWLHRAGHLTDRQAGRAAAPAPSPTVGVR